MEIKIGGTYRLMAKPTSWCYHCIDIIESQGLKVTVIGESLSRSGSYSIRDERGMGHCCEKGDLEYWNINKRM